MAQVTHEIRGMYRALRFSPRDGPQIWSLHVCGLGGCVHAFLEYRQRRQPVPPAGEMPASIDVRGRWTAAPARPSRRSRS